MKEHLKTALRLLMLSTLILGLAYPLLITILSQLLFPYQANGSVIVVNGQTIGSALIGQNFTQEKYFWGRPSYTTPFPYNAAASAASNFGPLNPEYIENVKKRAQRLSSFKSSPRNIPIDLVTGSGSGLDPYISVAAAYYQMDRIAKARNVPHQIILQLITLHTHSPFLGCFGEKYVHVLRLNRNLDFYEAERAQHGG